MRAPKGINANLACLKCCKPNGIPTMVKQKIAPKITSSAAITKPPRKIQMILMKKDAPLSLKAISLPNGAAAIFANLKHCKPIGIPTIERHQSAPITNHDMALINPPKTNQTTFPKKVIFVTSLLFKSIIKPFRRSDIRLNTDFFAFY